MKPILVVCFLFLFQSSFSQIPNISDSILDEMCKSLLTPKNKLVSDSDRIKGVLIKYISPLILNLNHKEQINVIELVFFRMQRNCKEFKSILERLETNKGDWVKVDEMPVSTLTEESYQEFLKIGKFYYKEYSGDTVHLSIANGIWEDHFKDDTYSRLKLRWLRDAEFQIEFIESNNLSRKNFSKPGDKYNYKLLEKDDKKYKLLLEIVGSSQFYTFYLYVDAY